MTSRDIAIPTETSIAMEETETYDERSISQLALFWSRLRRSPQTILGAGIFLMIVLMAIFAPFITPGVTPKTPFIAEEGYRFGVFGPTLDNFPARIFGTTAPAFFQASVLAQVTFGARPILLVSVISALIAGIIGTTLGMIGGYWGGWIDAVVMRVTDFFALIPPFPLVVLIITNVTGDRENGYFASTVPLLIATFGIVGWPPIARLLRAQMLVLRQQDYIVAAHASGIASWRIMLKHALPNVLPYAIVATILNVAKFIVLEATLDFLYIGIRTAVTWGNTLADAQGTITVGNWWWVFFPGLFMALTIFSLNLIGEGIRTVLDVRSYTR